MPIITLSASPLSVSFCTTTTRVGRCTARDSRQPFFIFLSFCLFFLFVRSFRGHQRGLLLHVNLIGFTKSVAPLRRDISPYDITFNLMIYKFQFFLTRRFFYRFGDQFLMAKILTIYVTKENRRRRSNKEMGDNFFASASLWLLRVKGSERTEAPVSSSSSFSPYFFVSSSFFSVGFVHWGADLLFPVVRTSSASALLSLQRIH